MAPVIGTENIEKVLDVGVEALSDYKSLKPEDNIFTKVTKFMPAILKGVAALDAVSKVVPEAKDLSPDEINHLVTKYSPLFGVSSSNTALYLGESAKIIGSGLRIIAALRQ